MSDKKISRKEFLTYSAALGVSGILGTSLLSSCGRNKFVPLKQPGEYYIPELPDKAIDGKELKVGVVGCGGRGSGAVMDLLDAADGIRIVALGDTFRDRVDGLRNDIRENRGQEVPAENCFVGFDSYRKVIDSGIDMVILTTPPVFRPEHFKAAVEARKHVFMEKPCAVDPTGIRTVIAAAKVAETAGLTVITGNQRRHQRDYWEAYINVRNGMIGDVIAATAHWDQGAWWNKKKRPEWSDMEYCIRNWFNIKWLSGDHILDQAVHNIDIVTWFMGMRPLSATGFGGRVRRLTGDIYDNFAADYTYDGNKRMLCTARQIDGCEGNVSEQILGTKGVALLSNGNNIRIEDYQGNILWKYDYEAKPVKNPYNQEHIHLVESIRLDKKINQAMDLAYSTQVAILGREAAYTGKRITWDEIMASNLRYGPTELRYGPTEYALGPLPDYHEGEAPKPGKDPQAPM